MGRQARIWTAAVGLAATLVFGCAPPAPTPTPSAAHSAALTTEPAHAAAAAQIIEEAMEADHIPAMSVAVMRDGALVWSEAFGLANLETGEPADRESKFRIGSVSKLFTADLAAILAEEGAVDLDADIRTYLPQFPDKGAPITLRQLLGHLGGVRHYDDKDYDFAQAGGPIDWRVYPDAAAILAIFANDPLAAAPGEKYVYSTFGFTLAGLVIEAATGRDYFELVTEKILAPAGIRDIAVDDMFKLVPGRVQPYDSIDDYEGLLAPEEFGPVVNAAPLNSAYKIPAGGLTADADAIAYFGELHVAPGSFSEKTYAALFTSQKTNAGEETGVGLAWRVGTDDSGRRLFQHSGSQQGSRAHLAVYPDDKLVIAILSNLGSRPQDVDGLSKKIAAAFWDGE